MTVEAANPETWLDEHGDYLYRYAYSRTGNAATSEDLVQETLMAGIKSLERYDGRVPPRAWLTGIIKHKIIDYFRKSSRETSYDAIDDEGLGDKFVFKAFGISEQHPEPWQFDPRDACNRAEFWQYFEKCLAGLNDNLRSVFVLRELEGVASADICKDLGITPNNYWIIMHRARKQLKSCLTTKWLGRDGEE